MAAHEKTEKATPKRREESRNKGQVAKSADLNGAVVLAAGLAALAVFGGAMVGATAEIMRHALELTAVPREVEREGLGAIAAASGIAIAKAMAPVLVACGVAAIVVNVAQVNLKLTPAALKPDVKRINPVQGAKNIFGPRAGVEALKAVLKAGSIGAIVAVAILPELEELGSLVGMPPAVLAARLVDSIMAIAIRGAAAYFVLGALDYGYQRHKHEKSLKMDLQEVKEEHKQQNSSPEVRAAIRRRQQQAARARMMAAVPTADVVVTNPTHYAVALKYEAGKAAPEVVAKGVDLVAKRIREIATEAGVPIVPDPPLARSLHASVEVGHTIPEELYQAVAGVLAFVYRLAGRRRAA